MQLSDSQWVILFFMIFDTYLYFVYMSTLFGKPRVKKIIIVSTFAGYYVLLSALFLFINLPIIILVYNIIAYLALTFNYSAHLTKRVLSSLTFCLVSASIEFILYIFFEQNTLIQKAGQLYIPIWQAVVVRLIMFIAVYFLIILANIKNDRHLPQTIWYQLILIPVISLFLFVNLTYLNLSMGRTIIFIVAILIINFIAIRLYKEISSKYEEKYKQLILVKQNEYYINQFALMNESIKMRNAERHDFNNHLSVIASLIQRNEQAKAKEYIASVFDVYRSVKEVHYSGNLVIDSIINYKKVEAEQNGVSINIELNIPENLGVNSFDMTTILGNIIDNAIHATKKLEKDKVIDLSINYNKGRLFIKISNPYNGQIKYENKELVTLHEDRESHGIGLNNVKAVLERYNGTLQVEHSDCIFSLMLLMFIKS